MCLGLFAGCGGGGNGGEHTHTYASTWSSDETNHWHAATCEHTDEVSDLAAHTFGNWEVVTEQTCVQDGVQERTCTVCGYIQEQKLPATGEHEYEIAVQIEGDCITDEQTAYKCKHCSKMYEEIGDKDPSKHHSTVFACGSHCASCAPNTAAADHAAAACGLSGHYICDGQDHIQCTIPVDENMTFEETADGTGMILTGFEAAGTETEILVPAYVEGKPVVEIADGVFDASTESATSAWLQTVTYLYIPDTVTAIGDWFAWYMFDLTELRLPKAVEFGEAPVFDCLSLPEYSIPRGTVTFSNVVGFSGTQSDTPVLETIAIPSSFTGLDTLKTFFTVGENVAVNYEGTEEEWTALVDTVSDADLKAILTADTFEVTFGYNYEAQYTEESNALQLRISDFTFDFVDGGVAITGYVGDAVETLAIPAAIGGIPVVALAQDALEVLVDGDGNVTANANLASVKTFDFTAATSLTTIGNYNFYNLDALETVALPDSVTYIGAQCFYDCPNLTTVTLPAGATMNMNNAPFAYCGKLTSVTLPGTLEGTSNAGAFAVEGESERNLSVSFSGSRAVFDLHTKPAAANLADATINCFVGSTTVQDGNGVIYLLCEDADGNEYYTLAGFYDTVNNPDDGVTPVAAYTIPLTYNNIPIKAIGEAVFNANAYVNEDIANWLGSSLGAIVLEGGATGTNIDSIGNYNYVGLAATQINQPDSIINETLVGCYCDLNAAAYIRVPRGVKVLDSCFQWSGTYFGASGGKWLVLPASLEKFSGESWTGTASSNFGVVMDVDNAQALSAMKAVFESSDCTTAGWSSIVAWFGTFTEAIVLGAGHPTGFSYDLFITLGY